MFHLFRRKERSSIDRQVEDAFPTRQLFILALCRICEPIAFMSIFPYIYYMIQSFHITSSDKQIAIYAGLVTSAFAFAEFSTSVMWGRLSDVVGRKPILLMGLAGTGISMIIFGFAKNLQVALLARALGGLLNGNIAVLQTTVAEVVKRPEHRPRAFAIMPFVWCLGSIIGSGLGGSLAEPVKHYPSVFGGFAIFEKYPYLLPNVVCTILVVFGLVIGILFLEETHEKKKDRRDPGLALGKYFLRKLSRTPKDDFDYSSLANVSVEETYALMIEGQSSHEASPRMSTASTTAPDPLDRSMDLEAITEKPKVSTLKALNKQVLLSILSYGLLAYHTIAFEQLMPVLLSMDESPSAPSSCFKFIGGFGLPSNIIGLILSLQGVYQMGAQMILFPWVISRFGALRTFRFTALTYPLLYLVVPYLAQLPTSLRWPALVTIFIWKVTHQSFAYPSNMLLLTSAAPSLLVLGVLNGFAASAASLARAIGPTLSGVLQSVGLDAGYVGIPWWVTAAVAVLGAVECLFKREITTSDTNAPASQDREKRTEECTPRTSDITLVGSEYEEEREHASEKGANAKTRSFETQIPEDDAS